MKMLKFSCPCGLRLTAVIYETPVAFGVGPVELRIYAPEELGPGRGKLKNAHCKMQRVGLCPNCLRDFTKVTVDEFLQNVWP